MTFDTALAGSGIVAASISGDAAQAIFAGAPDKNLEAVQKDLDSGNPHVAGFAIPDVTVTVKAAVQRETQTGRNVVAYLPRERPRRASSGRGWRSARTTITSGAAVTAIRSPARKKPAAFTTAPTTTRRARPRSWRLQKRSSKQPRRRHVLVGFWSAEEIGLIGSNAFVNKPPVPPGELAAYLNFDMVGRMVDNKLTVQATGTSPVWARILEQANVAAGFELVLQPDPYQPTDVASFNQASVFRR